MCVLAFEQNRAVNIGQCVRVVDVEKQVRVLTNRHGEGLVFLTRLSTMLAVKCMRIDLLTREPTRPRNHRLSRQQMAQLELWTW